MAVAEAYRSAFSHRVSGRLPGWRLATDELYDFLYEHDSRAWLMNMLQRLSTTNPRALVEVILKLHTGETVAAATPDWEWDRRSLYGQQVLLDLAQPLLKAVEADPEFLKYRPSAREAIEQVKRALQLDGYDFADGRLRLPEESAINEPEEEGVLEGIARSLQLPQLEVLKHHLELAGQHYLEGRWDDSIANSRKVLEWVLTAAASRHAKASGQEVGSERPAASREYLERVGLLDRTEREALDKNYGLLSKTGGHPYIAAKEQARLNRHLSLTLSQFVLLRVRGAVTNDGSHEGAR